MRISERPEALQPPRETQSHPAVKPGTDPRAEQDDRRISAHPRTGQEPSGRSRSSLPAGRVGLEGPMARWPTGLGDLHARRDGRRRLECLGAGGPGRGDRRSSRGPRCGAALSAGIPAPGGRPGPGRRLRPGGRGAARGAIGRAGAGGNRGSGSGWLSRLVLGSSDVFSGLFAVRRSLWERGGRTISASGSSLVLELLLRRPARSVDVPVPVDPRFRSPRLGLRDLRPLKHVLDGRYGNYSRLIQFCVVGASGMVVDLTFYALFQWLLSFTWLASRDSSSSGSPGTWRSPRPSRSRSPCSGTSRLNRRLTFNDATKGSWLRQFLTYALSNALAIALSFSLRLYLPTQVGFFARHRLAAAVVGIVAATGISFSMSRWIVFARRPELETAGSPASPAARSASLQPWSDGPDRCSGSSSRGRLGPGRSRPRRDQGDRRHDRSTHPQVGPEEGVDERQADHDHRRRDPRPVPERPLQQARVPAATRGGWSRPSWPIARSTG